MKSINILILLIVATAQAFCQPDSAQKTGIDIMFVRIPAGSFVYGRFEPPFPKPDTANNKYRGLRKKDFLLAAKYASRDHRSGFKITICQEFELSQFEITQSQWERVMGNNPSVFRGSDKPVDNVTWFDANAFIKRLNQLDTNHHYRLPSEFEWEYAARAGGQHDISWNAIREQAHLGTTSTNSVGTKRPNAWGLYDMLGNVWEWTSDWYNEKIFADSIAPESGKQHVLKGASFTGDVKNATYMTHAGGPANGWDVGFRILREKKHLHVSSTDNQYKVHKKGGVKTTSVIPGWHMSRTTHQGTTPAVTLSNRTITLQQNPYGQGGVLLTNRKYRDFELIVDVKIDSFCNGGIFLRSTESGQAYQVELSEPGGTGNLLGEMLKISKPAVAENKRSVWKPNQWNNFRIQMVGEIPRITLWINGVKMWDVTQPQNDFIAGATEGMIGLQVHWSATYSSTAEAFDMSSSWRPDGKHLFRNIKIRELTNSSQPREASTSQLYD